MCTKFKVPNKIVDDVSFEYLIVYSKLDKYSIIVPRNK